MAMLILVGSHEGPRVYLSWSEGQIPSCSTMSRSMGLDKDYEIIWIVVGITRTRKRSDWHKDDRLALSSTTYIVWQKEWKCDVQVRLTSFIAGLVAVRITSKLHGR